MKIPEKIIGRNKIRDAAICNMFEELNESESLENETLGMIYSRISEKFNLTERQIFRILRTNHAVFPIDRDWEKKKRINRLKREIAKKPVSQKDVADLMEQLRKEIDGERPLIEQHSHVTYIWQSGEANNSDSLLPAESPERNSLLAS
jgi:hypothetical protein